MAASAVEGDAGAALKEYITAYLTLAREGTLWMAFGKSLAEQVFFPFLVFVFGFTAAGIVMIPGVFAVKGFFFTFSVACFCRLFGKAGLLPALILFGLTALIWAPVLFVLGCWAVGSSYQMLRRLKGQGGGLPFLTGRYWLRCGGCAIVLLACAVFQHWVIPVLIGMSAGAIL